MKAPGKRASSTRTRCGSKTRTLLTSGPVLGVQGDFLTRDGKPFFPVGTNYFNTEENGWDFSGPAQRVDLGTRFRRDGKTWRQLCAHGRLDAQPALRRGRSRTW